MAFNIGPRIGIEGEKELKDALRAIIEQYKQLDNEMKAMETAFKRGEKSQKAYTDYQDKNAKATELLNKLTEEYAKWVDIAATKHGESSAAAERYRTEIAKVSAEQEQLKTRAKDASEAEEEFADKTEKTTEALSALETALVAAGVTKGIQAITDALRECVDASVEFEASMAGVSRTTGLTGAELTAMGNVIKELATEIPISQTELARVVEVAGQLGIATEDLQEFSTVMAKLGTATDLTSENAATLLAQFVNITGTKDFERLGSTVAALGDETATTASRIVEMSQGLAATASIAGLNEREMLAISAAVSALGVNTQAGATAMSTLLQKIYTAVESGGESLNAFAKTAGMTAGQFRAAWNEDAGDTLVKFIDGLNDVERNGQSAIMMLSDLGITNVRQTRAVLGLAEAEGLLQRTMDKANEAWNENTALTNKAATMYDTTQAKFTMFKNSVANLKIAIGDVLTPALAELADTGADASNWAAGFVEEYPEVVAGVTGLAAATATLAAGVTGVLAITKAVTLLKTALAALSAGGVYAVAITGIVAALVGVITTLTVIANDTDTVIGQMHVLSKEVQKTRKEYQENLNAIDKTADANIDLLKTVSELAAKENKSAGEKALLLRYTKELNEALPDLALNYDENTDSLTAYGNGLKVTSDELENYVAFLAEQQKREENLSRLVELKRQMNDVEEQLANAKEKVAEAEANNLNKIPSTMAAYAELKGTVFGYESTLAALTAEYDELLGNMEQFNDSPAAASESTAEMSAILEGAKTQIDALAGAYNAAYEAIYESLKGVGGPLKELEANIEITTAQVGKNLDTQVTYWETYGQNLDNLLARDVEGIEKLVKHFNDGSADSAGALAALATATDEELQKMVNDLDKADKFKKGIAEAFADAQTNASAQMQQIVSDTANKITQLDLSAQARAAGIDTLQGYINGLNLKSGPLYDTIFRIARQTIVKMRAGLDSHSPSRAFEDIGVDTLLGYIKGLDDKTKAVMSKMREVAQSAISAFNNEDASLSIGSIAYPIADSITERMGGAMTSSSSLYTTNNTTNLGSVAVNIYPQPGQSAQEIANAVMDVIQSAVDSKGAVFA